MADQDPLCRAHDENSAMICRCNIFRQVRGDERRRVTNFLNSIGQHSCAQLIEVYARQVKTDG